MRKRWFDQLRVGTYLTYWGARRSLFHRRGFTLARVVALDSEVDVAHLQTYCYDSIEDPITHICHIPAHRSSIEQSIHALHGAWEPRPEPPSSLSEWRERQHRGEVTGFGVPLWEAREMIWGIVVEAYRDATAESHVVFHAFPKLAPDGAFSVIEVSCGLREPEASIA